MWLLAVLGVFLRNRFHHPQTDQDSGSLSTVVSATLTLLGLIISFTFSMAATRYDQRRLFEENEANAIGTEYVRTQLMPPEQAATVRHLLLRYLDRRIEFFESGYGAGLTHVDESTLTLQNQLWQASQPQSAEQKTPVDALAVSGMNDVLNTQGYTQFAWWNRIPSAAWALMIVIALFANGLVGYATKRSRSGNLLLLVLPLIVSVSFFLIADIDSPRGGDIQIHPLDLMSLQRQLHGGRP